MVFDPQSLGPAAFSAGAPDTAVYQAQPHNRFAHDDHPAYTTGCAAGLVADHYRRRRGQ